MHHASKPPSQLLMGGSGFHLPCLAACPRQMGCSWGRPGNLPLPPSPSEIVIFLPTSLHPFSGWSLELGDRGGNSPKQEKGALTE